MDLRVTALRRAFELAVSGEVSCLTELKAKLRREGYGSEVNTLAGKGLKMQLINLIVQARQFTLP
jgi:hypothetical protein